MADINLLPQDERRSEGLENIRKKLSIVSILMLVFVAIAALGTLIFYTALASERENLVEQIEVATKEIIKYKRAEELVTVTKEKASVVDTINSSRVDQASILTRFSEIVPQNVYFNDFKLSQGKFSISGRARSSQDMAGFVSSLISPKGAKIITGANIDSLSSNETGQYDFSLSASLVAKKE